ncbi:hypothetical protein FQR65_LT02386 [Abscondita terminalis]|nr:hypothetical protein FQR65_LT02386 [Abscondita terminalis]
MYQETTISNKRVVASQVSAVVVKNLLIFSMGMSIGHTITLIPALVNDPMFLITKEEASWIGSINFITLFVGSASSGFVTQKIGRKTCMQLSTIPLTACWMTLKFCNTTWQIFASVVVSGCTYGLIEAPVLAYVAEITQPYVRGLLAPLNSVMITIGLIVQFGMATFLSWRNTAAVSGTIPILACLLLFFVPESPHWLIMHKRLSEAQKSLAWLRGWTTTETVKTEFEKMCNNHRVSIEDDAKTWSKNTKMYFRKSFCWPLSIMFLFCFVAGFSGCLTLLSYAVNVFATFQVPINQYYATFVFSISQLLGFIMYIILIRSQGKRLLLFISLCGCSILSFALGLYAYINNAKYVVFQDADKIVNSTETFNWLPLVLLILLGFFYNSGMKAVVWVVMGELFSHETRGIGCGIMGATFYGCIFISNKTFWLSTDYFTFPVVLWIYSIINLMGFVILYFTLPETEGKSLDEISNHFLGISKLDNKVKEHVSA